VSTTTSSCQYSPELCRQSDRIISGSIYRAALSREERYRFPQSIFRPARTYHFRALTTQKYHEGTSTAHSPNLSSVRLLVTGVCGFDSCISFHQAVKDSLERKRADVVELYQPMTEPMREIHGALVQCMSTTLAELKRSNTTVCSFSGLDSRRSSFRSSI
jgi:hypothetical protein